MTLRRPRLTIALTTAVASGALTWWAFATESDRLFPAFFVPGMIGFMLGGGVHSGFPEWWMLTSSSVFAALTWGVASYILLGLISFLRRLIDPPSSRRLPANAEGALGDHKVRARIGSMTGRSSNIRKRLTVQNTSGRPLTFILEPWADEHPMAPGERFVVEGDGPAAYAEFTVEQTDEYLIVWAWDGSDARVLRENGSIVWDWTGLRVPNFREP